MNIVTMHDKETAEILGYAVFSSAHDDVISPTFQTEAECNAFIDGVQFSQEFK
jgi:hypothetical protein